VHTTFKEQFQQHTAVHVNSWLLWTATNLRLQHTVNHFYISGFPNRIRRKIRFVSCGCFLHALFEPVEEVRVLVEFDTYRTGKY